MLLKDGMHKLLAKMDTRKLGAEDTDFSVAATTTLKTWALLKASWVKPKLCSMLKRAENTIRRSNHDEADL